MAHYSNNTQRAVIHELSYCVPFVSLCPVFFLGLEATTKTQHQVKSRLFLDVVVAEGTTILKLLASKDETLLVWWDAFLVLDLGLDVLDGVTGLHFEGDGLSS